MIWQEVVSKITLANLRKLIHDVKVIPVSSDLLHLETVERKEKITKNWISRERKGLFNWNKTIFITFEMHLVKFIKKKTQALTLKVFVIFWKPLIPAFEIVVYPKQEHV